MQSGESSMKVTFWTRWVRENIIISITTIIIIIAFIIIIIIILYII